MAAVSSEPAEFLTTWPGDTCLEKPRHVLTVGVLRKDEDLRPWAIAPIECRLQSPKAGHGDVHQHDVGIERAAALDRLLPSAASPTTSTSSDNRRSARYTLPQDGVVVGDEDADFGHEHWLLSVFARDRHAVVPAVLVQNLLHGAVMRECVRRGIARVAGGPPALRAMPPLFTLKRPASAPQTAPVSRRRASSRILAAPPISSMRSRRPVKPRPRPDSTVLVTSSTSKPTPLSSMSICRPLPPRSISMRAFSAPEWRAMLLTASWTDRNNSGLDFRQGGAS